MAINTVGRFWDDNDPRGARVVCILGIENFAIFVRKSERAKWRQAIPVTPDEYIAKVEGNFGWRFESLLGK